MSTTIPQDSTSTSPSPAVAPDDYNRHVIEVLLNTPVDPFTLIDTDGSQWRYVLEHRPLGSSDIARNLMFELYRCRTCANRVGKLCRVSGVSGSVLNCFNKIPSAYVHHEAYHKMAALAAKATDAPISDLILLDKDTLFGDKVSVGGFEHIVCPVEHPSANTQRIQLIKDAFQRYVISGLFHQFLTRLIAQGEDSLALLMTCLDKAAYGHKFIPAAKWCKSVLDDLATHAKQWDYFSPKEKISFALHHIIRAGLSKDFIGTVALLFQTANGNIVELLEDAKSEAAMTKLCQDRLNPLNYLRPTAEPTVDMVKKAAELLRDFTNKILTYERAKELIREVVCHGRNVTAQSDATSSMTGFSALIANAKAAKAAKAAGAPSFASRCGKSSLDVKIKEIKTLKQFVQFTRDHPELSVEISLDSGSIAYAAETTLSREMIAHRHIWAFMTESSKAEFGLTGSWAPVAMTLPMYEYIDGHKNCLFVIEGIKPGSNLGNCCFPELLTSQYQRVCRTAFEGLNRTTKVGVPSGQLMMGIGTSVTDAYGKLSHTVNLRVAGIPVRLLTL